MGLFKKKCEYCRQKIDNGEEHFEEVKVPGYTGVFKKPFCSKDHASDYIEEINKAPVKKGGCCG